MVEDQAVLRSPKSSPKSNRGCRKGRTKHETSYETCRFALAILEDSDKERRDETQVDSRLSGCRQPAHTETDMSLSLVHSAR
jgi:hypothetical protein